MSMAEAMAAGTDRYTDALTAIQQLGPAIFTQTGGMCAAIELTLERGYLLITDAEDSLPWSRQELRGWGVGYYRTQDVSEGPEAFASTHETSVAALKLTIQQCLKEVAISRRFL